MTAPDLRALALAATAWISALLAWTDARWLLLGAVGVGAGWVGLLSARRRSWALTAAVLVTSATACASASLNQAAIEQDPVHRLAESGASVTAVLTLRSDPVLRPGRFSARASAEAEILEVTHHDRRLRTSAPVLVLLPAANSTTPRGTTLQVAGSLAVSDRPERAAVLALRGDPVVLRAPSGLTAVGNRMRSAVREAVAGQPTGPRALVPALVDGQDGELPRQVVEDFRTTGMTHLLAVSGTNLTLIVGFLLVLARGVGLRSYALIGVGILGVGGFLLLAGPEPSVLRAAAMGVVALVGLGSGGRQRGLQALGIGTLLLVLTDPWLARSVGFALSVVATAAILLLVPRWREALGRWMPRWLAEAIAVPLAAQIACTPLVAVISGEISLVAVVANLLASPLVAPATVVGLVAGLVALISEPVGRLLAAPACWAAAGLIAIAEHAAAVPVPALGWSGAPFAVVVLTALCVAMAALLHRILVRRWATTAVAGLLVVVVVVPLPTPGWPPPGWVLTVCSVGQGDGLVLRVADGSAVVIDAGPDPDLIDGCLRRLGIRTVPVVVLTHFHADHIDGLRGVVEDRRVGEIVTSPLADPDSGADTVGRLAGRHRIPVRPAQPGESAAAGALRWQVLAPTDVAFADSESPPNDASVVMLVESAGIRILLMGDQERPSQEALRREYPGLRADVVKVAHHGSSKQDAALVEGLGARVALISVGAENGYGHPAPSALTLLYRAGLQVHRTDQEGDLAVVVTPAGELVTVVSGTR